MFESDEEYIRKKEQEYKKKGLSISDKNLIVETRHKNNRDGWLVFLVYWTVFTTVISIVAIIAFITHLVKSTCV